MNEGRTQLPDFVRRPLMSAAAGIVIFLGAFTLWAVLAPLATTVTLRGSIESSQPSFTLQHPYGGLVQDVLVETHDRVTEGQALLRFDTSLEQETLASQISIRDRLRIENELILRILGASNVPLSPDLSPLVLRKHQLELQGEAARNAVEGLERQISALQSKIGHANSQLALMSDRATRFAVLSRQGLTRRTDDEHLKEQILIVKGEIDADRASVFNLQGQVIRTKQQQELAIVAFEHELTSQHQHNLERLDQLESSILELTDRIERSILRAPSSGIIASLPVETEHMIAARGATLVTLASELREGRISFSVPVDYIDQIAPGMSARLVIPSLPQRQMPKIDVVIDAISPRADLDEGGNPIGFAGQARADLSALEQLNQSGGLNTLSEDMPIILMVSVRETTFADYLITPLTSAFSTALQD